MKRCLLAAATLLAAASACADVTVEVKDAWVRASVPGQKASGAFMQLTALEGGKLVGARSPIARVVEIHEMAMDDQQVMHMRAVPSLALPAGKPVALKPGGYHIMLIDLNATMQPGKPVPLTLLVVGKDGEEERIDVQLPVKPLNVILQ
jgi:copper(I)-binding protein